MRRNIIALSLIASSLIADTNIDLYQGWNLVSIPNEINGVVDIKGLNSDIESVVSYSWADGPFGKIFGKSVDPTTTTAAQGYWIKSKSTKTITIPTTSTLATTPSFVAGWNLVGFNANQTLTTLEQAFSSSVRFDSIVGYSWADGPYGKIFGKSVDPTDIKNNLGYWVKVSAKAFEANTVDGYTVKAFANSTVDATAIQTQIKNSMVDDLYMISDWANVTEIVIGNGGVDASGIATSSLTQTTIETSKQEIVGDINIVPIYVNGMTDGGAPFILSDVAVYDLDDNLLGYTDENGYLNSIALVPGMEIVLVKNGYVNTTVILSDVSTEYIFIEENNFQEIAEVIVEDGIPRILNRKLDYIAISNNIKGNFDVLIPQIATLKKSLPKRVLKNSNKMSITNPNKLKQVIDTVAVDGYDSEVLGILNYSLTEKIGKGRKARDTYKYEAYAEYYPDETATNIYYALDIDTFDKVDGYVGNTGKNLRVLYFDGDWKELASENFRIKAFNDLSQDIVKEAYRKENVFGKIDDVDKNVIEIDSLGFYPHVIVYDEKAIETYQLKINVMDEAKEPIVASAVYMSNLYIGSTNDKGVLENTVTAKTGDLSFSINAEKSKYLSSSLKVVQIDSLDNINSNDVNITLKAMPNVGSVEGTVFDSNLDGCINGADESCVDFANVKLHYPYSLGVDVVKVNDDSVEVGSQPNTKYTWFMKIYDEEATPSPYVLGRISKDRWIEVQSGDSASEGNILTFNKMKVQLLRNREVADAADVLGAMVSGTFELAITVAHDLDADGTDDLIELAALKDVADTNLVGDISGKELSNYAATLGKINIEFDIVKFTENALTDERVGTAVYVGNDWYYADDYDYNDGDELSKEYYDNLSGVVTADKDLTLVLAERKYSLGSIHSDLLNGDYKLSYNLGIYSTLGDGTSVCLVKNDSGNYVWEKILITNESRTYTEMDDKNALFEIGSVQRIGDEVKGSDLKLSVAKASAFISQNRIMEKLNMTMAGIASEVDVTYNEADAEKTLMQTGLGLAVTGMIEAKNDSGTDVKVIAGSYIASNAIDDLSGFLNIKNVEVRAPIKAKSVYEYITKADGKYKFANLPMEYAQLGDKTVSMLKVNAIKYAHNDSAVQNILAYDVGEVDNQNIDLKSKDLVSVTINIVDVSGNEISADSIKIDGEFMEVLSVQDDYAEHTSIADANNTTSVTFDDIISGKRIIEVSKEGYYPVNIEKGVYVDNTNTITVELKQASNLDSIVSPSVSIVSNSVNYDRGLILLDLEVNDKANNGGFYIGDEGQLTTVIVYRNGTKINSKQNIDANGFVKISIVPNIGENEIYVKVINPKGEMTTGNLHVDYNPLIGSLKGTLSSFRDIDANQKIDDDNFVIVEILNSSMEFVSSVVPDADGNYFINKLQAGEAYLQAKLFANDGTLIQQTDREMTIVVGGITKSLNLSFSDVAEDTSNWTPDITLSADIDEAALSTEATANNGEITLSGEVKEFDKLNGAQLITYVNGNPYIISQDNITKVNVDANSTYNWTTKVTIGVGENILFVEAVNSNNNVDTTPEFHVNNSIAQDDLYTVNFTVKDEANNTIPYASVSMYTDIVGYKEILTDNNGVASFISLTNAIYDIKVAASGYTNIAIIDSLSTLDSKDGNVDHNVSIQAKLYNEDELEIITTTISDINISQIGNNLDDGTFLANTMINVNINVDGDANAVTYEYIMSDLSDESVVTKGETQSFDYLFKAAGDYIIRVMLKNGDIVIEERDIMFSVIEAQDELIMPPVTPELQ